MRAMRIALVFLFCVGSTAFGQDRAADEKAIRDIVAKINASREGMGDLFLPDAVYVVGSMVKPVVGNEKPQYRPGSSAGPKRTNETSHEQIVQLQISASGDMAYEYSTFKQSWIRTDNNQKVEGEGALLRTWRKVDGRWRIGAQFRRPNDDSPTTR